jgi:hypothetical protein
VGISRALFRVADFRDAIESPYSLGPLFPFSVDFHRFGSIWTIFWGSFSQFAYFYGLATRYTRTPTPRLMYSPSENKVEAPQLGPRGYRIFHFCPACGFRIKPLVSFGPIGIRRLW